MLISAQDNQVTKTVGYDLLCLNSREEALHAVDLLSSLIYIYIFLCKVLRIAFASIVGLWLAESPGYT